MLQAAEDQNSWSSLPLICCMTCRKAFTSLCLSFFSGSVSVVKWPHSLLSGPEMHGGKQRLAWVRDSGLPWEGYEEASQVFYE